jgi:hypothetical protein
VTFRKTLQIFSEENEKEKEKKEGEKLNIHVYSDEFPILPELLWAQSMELPRQ